MTTKRANRGEGKYPTGVTRTSSGKFRFWIMDQGRRVYSRSPFTNPADASAARKLVLQKLTRIDDHGLTLEEGIARVEALMDRKCLSSETRTYYRAQWLALRGNPEADEPDGHFHSDTLMARITRRHVEDFFSARMAEVSVNTVHKNVLALSRIFRVCELQNPITGMEKPRRQKPRFKYLTKTEFDEWYARLLRWRPAARVRTDRLNLPLDLFIPKFLYCTGLRRSEIAGMRVQDIDLERKRIYVLAGKTGARELPAGKEVIKALTEFVVVNGLKPADPLIGTKKEVTNLFQRWQSRIGDPVTPHALRHGFGTRLGECGYQAHVIMGLMGHSTVQMAMHYITLTQEVAQEAVDAIL